MANIISEEVIDGYRVTTYDDGMVIRVFESQGTPPAVVRPLSRLEFLRRFTAPERVAIRQSTDPYVQDFYHLLDAAAEVRVDDPDTVAGLAYLAQIGLLTQARADAILEG